MYKKILIVATDATTKFVDWTDRTTCVLFGDGAGAAVVESDEKSDVDYINLVADGENKELISLNIPNENFVYNALAPNLKLGLDYSIKDITIFVYDNDKEILSRKYVVNSLLVPQKKAPAKSSEKEKASSKKNA